MPLLGRGDRPAGTFRFSPEEIEKAAASDLTLRCPNGHKIPLHKTKHRRHFWDFVTIVNSPSQAVGHIETVSIYETMELPEAPHFERYLEADPEQVVKGPSHLQSEDTSLN